MYFSFSLGKQRVEYWKTWLTQLTKVKNSAILTALVYTKSYKHSGEKDCSREIKSCCLFCLLFGLWATPVCWPVLTSDSTRCTHWADVLLLWMCFWLFPLELAVKRHLCPGMPKAPDISMVKFGEDIALLCSMFHDVGESDRHTV